MYNKSIFRGGRFMCIFCKIADGSIPSYKLYEDDKVLAFLDINPVSKGHTVVIPKHHCEHVLDCNDEVYTHLMLVVKKLGINILKTLNADGLNLITNCKEAAGQTVPHFHFHIIPRFLEGDGFVASYIKQEGLDLLQLQHDLKCDKL